MKTLSRYTCPLLMLLQFALMRMWPFGRPVRIRTGAVVRVMPAGHGAEARCWWPRWMILAECWAHNYLRPRLAMLARCIR